MRSIVALFAALAAIELSFSTAAAVSPVYCTRYAREFVKLVDGEGGMPPTFIRDRAYSICLNLDERPPLPSASMDLASAEVGGQRIVEEEGDAAVDEQTPDEEMVALEPVSSPRKEVAAKTRTPSKSRVISSLEMWSPEWKAWCTKHFPKSFDPETGTVVPNKTGVRTAC
jgi:hypothetical protein